MLSPKKNQFQDMVAAKMLSMLIKKTRTAAEKGYDEAKQKYNELKSKPNKTKEDNEALQKAERAMKHEKQKMDNTGENHSQKAKVIIYKVLIWNCSLLSWDTLEAPMLVRLRQ